jgi:tRNA(Ile)-lysidine synthase
VSLLETLAARVAAADPPPPGRRILAACSGGADSVALLHLLVRLAPGRGWGLAAAHLDHGLRGAAGAADRTFVEELCRDLDLPLRAERRPVEPGGGLSPEEAARETRRSFLAETAREEGAGVIALAHNADDQAETVLLRLARGTGPGGLRAMAVRSGRWWRPLLGTGREEIREALREAGLSWREDETNEDLRFDRNRVRLEVLPPLRSVNPRAVRNIGRLAELAREDEALLESLARDSLEELDRPAPEGAVALEGAPLAALPPSLGGRVVRLALASLSGGASLPRRQVRALLSLAAEAAGGLSLPSGLDARMERGLLMLRLPAGPPPRETPLPRPGSVRWGTRGRIQCDLLDRSEAGDDPREVCGPRRALLDAGVAEGELRVRGPREGDRFRALGAPGARPLADFLREAGVARAERATVPLVTCGGRIAWVAGHRIDERYRVGPGTTRLLELRWSVDPEPEREGTFETGGS